MQDNETTIDELSATRARSRANLDKGRGLRAHKPDCGCRPCTKRRRVAAQAVQVGPGSAQGTSPSSTPGEGATTAVDEQDMPPKPGASSSSTRVVTLEDGDRLFIASPVQQDQDVADDAQLDARVLERRAIRDAIVLEDGQLFGQVMDDWQREDLEALDRPGVRHALLMRPRGHSKTGDVGSEAVVELLTGKDKVMLAYAADADQARLLFTDVRDKLVRGGHVSDVSPRTATSKVATREPWQPGDPIAVHIYADRIESTSGNVLRVEASDVASSWGKRPDWICADEIVEWRRPELWQAIWSATGKRPRSRVICISTAGWDKSHFSWGIVELAQAEDDWYYSSRPQCASWIDPKWLAQQRRTLPEHVYKRLHENLWVDGFGAFLSSEEVERIFTLDGPPARPGRSAIGLDVGLTHDRTVLAAVRLFPGPAGVAPLLYCDALETWQGSRSKKVDLDDVQRSAYEASVRWRAPVYADPHQAEQLIQNLVKLGRVAKAYTFSSASRRDLFAGLFAAIRDGRLRCAPHEELRRELLGLEVQTTASGNYRVDHKAGRYDDHVIALSLAVHGALERSGSFHLESWSYTKRYTAEPAGQVIDSKGTRFLGDGRYRTASGEDFYNPRGM